jgi:MFS family permease
LVLLVVRSRLAAVPMTNHLAPRPILLANSPEAAIVDCRRARTIEACTVADTDRADRDRLRHRVNRVRSALDARSIPLAVVVRPRLGPRGVLAGDRHTESSLGAAQPFAGAVADRFGPMRVLCFGAILYATGLAWMGQATTLVELNFSAGVLIGFGLAGCSFPMVIGALGKLVPENWRGFAFGAGTAAGSFGQFLYSPLAAALIHAFSWQTTLLVFAGTILLVLPLSLALATPQSASAAAAAKPQSSRQALIEAFGHGSYVLLVLGFFTCGFQLAFVTVHLPSYLVDRGLGADVGAWTIGLIGLFNIIGSLSAGWLSGRMPKRYLLSIIYFGRAVAIVGLITLPQSTVAVLVFGAVTGLSGSRPCRPHRASSR